MSSINSSVDDIGASSRTSTVIVDIGGAATSLVGNTAQAPWSASLRNKGVHLDNRILLDVLNLFKRVVSTSVFLFRIVFMRF